MTLRYFRSTLESVRLDPATLLTFTNALRQHKAKDPLPGTVSAHSLATEAICLLRGEFIQLGLRPGGSSWDDGAALVIQPNCSVPLGGATMTALAQTLPGPHWIDGLDPHNNVHRLVRTSTGWVRYKEPWVVAAPFAESLPTAYRKIACKLEYMHWALKDAAQHFLRADGDLQKLRLAYLKQDLDDTAALIHEAQLLLEPAITEHLGNRQHARPPEEQADPFPGALRVDDQSGEDVWPHVD